MRFKVSGCHGFAVTLTVFVLFCFHYFWKEPDTSIVRTDIISQSRSQSFSARSLLWNSAENASSAQLGDSDDDSDVECRDVLKQSKSERCSFVKNTSDCDVDEGFIDYTWFAFCSLHSSLEWLALIILLLWWIVLFIGLAVTADDFFCPSLIVIAKTLHLSDNIAGVTFLAFGNGAPDIFSAIAAIGNAKNGDAGLAIGALFGAGVFVTTVVAGAIAIICPFHAMERPFLRDIIFYLAAAFWTFYVMWDHKIEKMEAIGFILLYVFYVVVVVVGRYFYQRSRTSVVGQSSQGIQEGNHLEYRAEDESEVIKEREPLLHGSLHHHQHHHDHHLQDNHHVVDQNYGSHHSVNRVLEEEEEEEEEEVGALREFLDAINPIDIDGWKEMRIYRKCYEILKAPVLFVLLITVPVVEHDEESNTYKNWNRHLNSLHCFTGLVISSLATKVSLGNIGGSFPIWCLFMIIGAVLGLIVFFTSKNDIPPKYYPLFGYLGFLVAVIWIYSIANEVVNILQTFGIAVNISNAILGLTLLAWGNSIGDLIADIAMARNKKPRTGISACFGGPLFNLLLGIGIPFTIGTIQKGGSYNLKVTLEEIVLAGFLALSLITSLVIVPLSKFVMSRTYGIILMILYVIFLVVAILTESNIISSSYFDNST